MFKLYVEPRAGTVNTLGNFPDFAAAFKRFMREIRKPPSRRPVEAFIRDTTRPREIVAHWERPKLVDPFDVPPEHPIVT